MWFKLTGDEHLEKRCASLNCRQGPAWKLEVDDYGSYYCGGCKEKIERSRKLETVMAALEQLYKECCEAGHGTDRDYNWPKAMADAADALGKVKAL